MESDVVVLEAMVVEGYREGRSRALQQKQSQTNISDIVSADAIGNLPDRNIAEAVARIPGVSITGMEQGEGRYVSIRGVDPNLNQVVMDGATLAAPGGTRLGRAVPLDTLGAGDIAQIEVIKSVTPDLDANSIGGTIKIKSASAFDRKGRFVSGGVTANHNEFASSTNLEGRINYSNLFGANSDWGIATSASYEEREYSNHWVQTGWNERTINGTTLYLPNGFEIKPEEGELKRYGGSLSLEYRPNEDTQFFFRPSFSATERFEHTVEIIDAVSNSNASQVTLTSPTSGTFIGNNRTERRDFRTYREQELLSFSAGFKKTWDNFTLEPMVTYSAAEETTPSNRILAFRNGNGQTGPIVADWSAFDFLRWERNDAIDTPNRYPLRRTRDDTGLVDEETMTAKVDLRWD
jgi:TonB-dependent receptor